ncbi:multicopper oxidase domain-containing protein [Schaalia sp. ZJ405]|uniref:multicopper oxidase domain-containing protein n=1 Tax=Schaalia sp. ZJ405 TaxID=2709403 RepID=UPI0013ED7307|nr:multicopper oxidase domain-containing protein [Schaalia sp. ZJ405]QPK81233.1 multicopper oxidase domain-containing protein [Schaalia sp. ZJ405]
MKSPASDTHSPLSRTAVAVMGLVTVLALVVAVILSNPGAPGAASSSSMNQTHEATASAHVTPTGETTRVTVGVDGMSFTPSRIEVPAGNSLIITFTNTGDQRHDLVLENAVESGSLAPGESTTLDVGIVSSHIEGWCSLPGHRQMGMVLNIIATGIEGDNANGEAKTSDSAGHTGHLGHAASSSSVNTHDLLTHAKTREPRDPTLSPIPNGDVHKYTFTITEHTDKITDTLTQETWTFNETSPGPTLHGKIGDTFRITLVNKGTMSHSIDFHAGLVSPDANMRSIEPGETLTYEFVAHNAGIWLYHCGTPPMSMHIANGMYGAVVIDPSDLDPVDHEYVMIAAETYLGANGETADANKLAAMIPDATAFNGIPFQYSAHPINVKVGDRIRVWVLDAGPNLPISFHVVGTQFDTVWREGDYLIQERGRGGGAAQVLSLQAAEGGFVEFTPLEAGHYPFVNHAMSLAEKGLRGVFNVTE